MVDARRATGSLSYCSRPPALRGGTPPRPGRDSAADVATNKLEKQCWIMLTKPPATHQLRRRRPRRLGERPPSQDRKHTRPAAQTAPHKVQAHKPCSANRAAHGAKAQDLQRKPRRIWDHHPSASTHCATQTTWGDLAANRGATHDARPAPPTAAHMREWKRSACAGVPDAIHRKTEHPNPWNVEAVTQGTQRGSPAKPITPSVVAWLSWEKHACASRQPCDNRG